MSLGFFLLGAVTCDDGPLLLVFMDVVSEESWVACEVALESGSDALRVRTVNSDNGAKLNAEES